LEAATRKKYELISGTKNARLVNQSKNERAGVIVDGEANTDSETEPDAESITVTFTHFECLCPNVVNTEEFSGNCPRARRSVAVRKRKSGSTNRSDEYLE
jgi:hypothetical protein